MRFAKLYELPQELGSLDLRIFIGFGHNVQITFAYLRTEKCRTNLIAITHSHNDENIVRYDFQLGITETIKMQHPSFLKDYTFHFLTNLIYFLSLVVRNQLLKRLVDTLFTYLPANNVKLILVVLTPQIRGLTLIRL